MRILCMGWKDKNKLRDALEKFIIPVLGIFSLVGIEGDSITIEVAKDLGAPVVYFPKSRIEKGIDSFLKYEVDYGLFLATPADTSREVKSVIMKMRGLGKHGKVV